MTASAPELLLATVTAVRDAIVKRLGVDSLNPDAKREMEMALEELNVMWKELQGEVDLLLLENTRYADAFEYSPDAYVITDLGGTVREANQAALELLGGRRDDVVARPLTDYVFDADASTVEPMLGGQPLAGPAHLRRAEAALLAVELSVRAIPLKEKGVGGLCWLIRPAA
jgi:PAS domain S-box-containing protein